MEDIVYIDQEDGKKRVMNNGKLYARLLTKFKTETRLDPVFEALDAGNWEEAQARVHAVKGITANLSIKALNQLVMELELQIKAKSVKPETIEAVKNCFAATLPKLEQVIEQNA
ncbi:MAG: Hpt domain-containing protein [Treponema sp.]|jgi:HPt (histidine-containing phosphotransfer) domain-containing protein|nr:Hpt domain-containing protein [Treponema sp.]